MGDYLNFFPHAGLPRHPTPFQFQTEPEDARQRRRQSAFGVDDLDAFLAETQTQSLLVIKDDQVVLERYVNGWQRDSMVTSFSVAKSFVSTLVGIAIDEGAIGSLDDPITDYLPELARTRSTIRADHDPPPVADVVRPGIRRVGIVHVQRRRPADHLPSRSAPAGAHEHTHRWATGRGASATTSTIPQLLGLILERTTGMSITALTQSRLWDPLGMEFDGAWTLDSEASGFEKMEAGLNARAIDFAKLGRLFLREGDWDGTQDRVVRMGRTATGVDPADRAPARRYGRSTA